MFVVEYKPMNATSSISIETTHSELLINIDAIGCSVPPAAVILNYSGELIEKIQLAYGINRIALNPYRSKNYSIRVTNGKNVITQKI